jgi:precorrin-8X/cobalt-precorrin-8 methylmutase
MVSEGITRARLPAANRVICTLHDAPVPGLAALGTTRSAAALELWRPHLAGAWWRSAMRPPRCSTC